MARKLWFQTSVVLDGVSGAQARSWALPPESYLRALNASRATFVVEYVAVGPGAAGVTATLECTPTDSDRVDDFVAAGTACNSTLSRTAGTVAWVLGGETGSRIGFPRGKLRVRLDNFSTTDSDWAGVQLIVWVEIS